MASSLQVWRFTDGKRGHENQSRGLVEALGRLIPVECHNWAATEVRAPLWSWLTGRFPRPAGLPWPQLVIGAGRRTHWAMLSAKRISGAKAVAIMRPSTLMSGLFDLCLVPELRPRDPEHMVGTRGAINCVRPGGPHLPDRGLILIGGPSRHYSWDSTAIQSAVRGLVQRDRSVRWLLSDSRRTPRETSQALAALSESNLQFQPVGETSDEWVPRQLAESGVAWVTEDSVSMVYEALTSGARVGVLPVPRQGRASRVARGVDDLIARGWCTSLEQWLAGRELQPPPEPLDEARRCARLLLERFSWGLPIKEGEPIMDRFSRMGRG